MKKISYVSVLVLCLTAMFAVSALGAETTFSGSYRIRAHSEFNVDKKYHEIGLPGYISHDDPVSSNWFEQRFRLTITHTRSEYLKAVVRLDIVEDTWGRGQAFRINFSGRSYIDLAYIEFTLPAVGTFTLGLFDEEYGHGLTLSQGRTPSSGFGFSGVRWKNAWGPVEVSAFYAKELEMISLLGGILGDLYNEDSDLWALDVKITPVEDHTLELYGGLYQNRLGQPILSAQSLYHTRSFYAALFKPNTTILSWGVVRDTNVGFVGAAYTGVLFDSIHIKGEYTHFFGEGHMYNNIFFPDPSSLGLPTSELPPRSVDLRGFNLYLDVSFNMDLFRVGVAFLMGSGQDHIWNPHSHDRININQLPFNDGIEWATILMPGDLGGLYTTTPVTWGTENLTSLKLFFEVWPVENLSITGNVIWAKWTKPVGSATANVGFNVTSRGMYVNSKASGYLHPMSPFGNYFYDSWNVSTDLGWEFDLGLTWRIMEGLTFSCDAGVLLTGDSFDYAKWNGTAFEREEWGPIWRVVNTLTYEF